MPYVVLNKHLPTTDQQQEKSTRKILHANLRARIRYETNYDKKGVLSNFGKKELGRFMIIKGLLY